jgi:2'-5' RNA ligase
MDVYETLWRAALAAFERAEPEIDPYLLDKANDPRRGVTLHVRPSAAVRDEIARFLEELSAICPGQYFYRPEELHVTALSIINMTEKWREEMARLEACRAILREALAAQHAFQMEFRGITASPSTVMVQGFPVGDGLLKIRDAIREAFARAGFGDMIDRRYKIVAAHVSAMRFCQPVSDWPRLISFLKENRERFFGVCEIDEVQLVFGDWFASAETKEIWEKFRLTDLDIHTVQRGIA